MWFKILLYAWPCPWSHAGHEDDPFITPTIHSYSNSWNPVPYTPPLFALTRHPPTGLSLSQRIVSNSTKVIPRIESNCTKIHVSVISIPNSGHRKMLPHQINDANDVSRILNLGPEVPLEPLALRTCFLSSQPTQAQPTKNLTNEYAPFNPTNLIGPNNVLDPFNLSLQAAQKRIILDSSSK